MNQLERIEAKLDKILDELDKFEIMRSMGGSLWDEERRARYYARQTALAFAEPRDEVVYSDGKGFEVRESKAD